MKQSKGSGNFKGRGKEVKNHDMIWNASKEQLCKSVCNGLGILQNMWLEDRYLSGFQTVILGKGTLEEQY